MTHLNKSIFTSKSNLATGPFQSFNKELLEQSSKKLLMNPPVSQQASIKSSKQNDLVRTSLFRQSIPQTQEITFEESDIPMEPSQEFTTTRQQSMVIHKIKTVSPIKTTKKKLKQADNLPITRTSQVNKQPNT